MAIFGDDSKLYKIISKPSDKISLQSTKVQDPKHPQEKITVIDDLDGTLLTTANETIDLSITITDNPQWSSDINQISLRVNRTLGLIHQICRHISDTYTRKLLYCSIVLLAPLHM